MKKIEGNYEYLLRLYSQVDEYLANTPSKQENLPEVIIAFCITVEKLFKIRLHGENPVLVYENSKIKENDALTTIIKEKELNIETIRIGETINRYKLMFENEFSDDEMQVLIDIYNIRNHFIHGYKSDDYFLSDKENIVKKMGTVWEKISTQAVSIFGKDLIKANKPKKKYSEEELEKVLIEEVKKKIQSTGTEYDSLGLVYKDFIIPSPSAVSHSAVSLGINRDYQLPSSVFALSGEQCPRCGSYSFSLDEANLGVISLASLSSVHNLFGTFSDLYKCKSCNLELTKKEYEIAKKLKK